MRNLRYRCFYLKRAIACPHQRRKQLYGNRAHDTVYHKPRSGFYSYYPFSKRLLNTQRLGMTVATPLFYPMDKNMTLHNGGCNALIDVQIGGWHIVYRQRVHRQTKFSDNHHTQPAFREQQSRKQIVEHDLKRDARLISVFAEPVSCYHRRMRRHSRTRLSQKRRTLISKTHVMRLVNCIF